MFVFGIDIPLVELIFAFTIIAVIILIEITIILLLMAYQMKNSKKLGGEIKRLSNTLMRLEDKELKELDKIKEIEDRKRELLKRTRVPIHHKIHRVAKAIVTGLTRKKPTLVKPKIIKHALVKKPVHKPIERPKHIEKHIKPGKIIIKRPIIKHKPHIAQKHIPKKHHDQLKDLLKDVDKFLEEQK